MPFITFAAFGLVLLVLLYLRAVRPQRQYLQAQHRVVAALEVDDRVISSAGIFGRITALTDDVVHLEIAPGVVIQVARPAIAHKVDLAEDDPIGSQLVDLTGPPTTVPSTDAAADGSATDDHPA